MTTREAAAASSFVFDPADTPARLRGGAVAIGNFDGVHRGHQAVLAVAREAAAQVGGPVLALTFEPHPRTLFRPDAPVYRLTPPAAKAAVMAAVGLDGLAVATFDAAFAAQTAEAFVDRILVEGLSARHVVVGHDFRFGSRRAGTVGMLEAAGAARGFAVSTVAPVADESGDTVSSTRVRAALKAGAVGEAARLLGYHPIVTGPVIHGEKRGRLMNYPTANQRLAADCRLAHGIYAVRARVGGRTLDGVASFGRRPTFDNGAPLLETFLFDFAGDLYGADLQVALVAFLRPEERFATMEALVEQMDRDSLEARAVLAGAAPLSPLDAALSFPDR